MAEKKTYVLWVVHTDVFAAIAMQTREAERERLYSSYGSVNLDQHFAELQIKYGLTKKLAQLYIEGVIRAMQVAQEAGALVIYEPWRFISLRKDLLDIAKKSGVKNAIRMRRLFSDPVKLFLKILKERGIQNFEVIFAGHYAERCILQRLAKLKERGFNPYLLSGTPVKYADYPYGSRQVKTFFGKDRLITIHQLKNLVGQNG